jgi:hypothetical protein
MTACAKGGVGNALAGGTGNTPTVGKINDVTQEELERELGEGDVTVILEAT